MLIASALALAALAYYAVLCAARPFAPCRKCDGKGAIERRNKKLPCRRCRGDRLRLRVGRRAYNAWLRAHHAGTRTAPTPFKENR
jgi:hypothetical protein